MRNNFLGLEKKYCDKTDSSIVILPLGFDKTTTYIHGSDKGPKAIIDASKNLELYDIETDFEVYKYGIYTAPEKKYSTSIKMLSSVSLDVKNYLKEKKFVVTIGGEHSISFAPIEAHGDFFNSFSVLHFDAHSDLRPSYDNTPHSHASVMSQVKKIPAVKNIVSVGIRSMDKEEKKFVDPKCCFFAHDIHHNNNWMEKATSLLSENIYITFDLDVFDSSLMPATGTPEPGGLFWHQVSEFLQLVSLKKNIIGFDVVELCPIKNFVAPDFLAAKLIYKILCLSFKKRKSQ